MDGVFCSAVIVYLAPIVFLCPDSLWTFLRTREKPAEHLRGGLCRAGAYNARLGVRGLGQRLF